MAKHSLVIVESPAKAKTIGKYLGKEFEVKACMGHLRDLPKSTLGVDLEHDFEPVYKPIKGKEDIIADLKKSAKSAEMVYLATDPDREGEAISWHLKQLLNLPDEKTRRVTFNEITKNVVQESIREPRDIDQKLVDAQQARRILDRIVGYEPVSYTQLDVYKRQPRASAALSCWPYWWRAASCGRGRSPWARRRADTAENFAKPQAASLDILKSTHYNTTL